MKIAVAGAAGRMGQMLIREIARTEGCTLAGALENAGSNAIGREAGEVAGVGNSHRSLKGVKIVSDPAAAIRGADAVIDFTVPAATVAHAKVAAQHGVPMVIGTTALDPQQTAAVHEAATKTAILWAANMSLGINILLALVEKTAAMLDPAYDIEVLEMHHRHKIDAPSGTALRMGEVIASALDRDLQKVAVYGREGHTGARERETIGFATMRGGDVVGDHTVLFACEGERLEITHKASSRMTFAKGAVRAALWLDGREPGLYDMQDVLELR
jgi:4-hydroxy-tetrahydrodipicolinate reductase